jgi:hypothetical protein
MGIRDITKKELVEKIRLLGRFEEYEVLLDRGIDLNQYQMITYFEIPRYGDSTLEIVRLIETRKTKDFTFYCNGTIREQNKKRSIDFIIRNYYPELRLDISANDFGKVHYNYKGEK